MYVVFPRSMSIVPFGISLTRLDALGNMLWSRLYQGTPFAGGSFGGTGLDVYGGGSSPPVVEHHETWEF